MVKSYGPYYFNKKNSPMSTKKVEIKQIYNNELSKVNFCTKPFVKVTPLVNSRESSLNSFGTSMNALVV